MLPALQDLGLDEALFSLNRSSSSIKYESLDVYYQINECFGCPLEKHTTLRSDPNGYDANHFVIGTKHQLDLQLRDSKTDVAICDFEDLQLNNHGHYELELVDSVIRTNNSSNITDKASFRTNCSIKILDQGECTICPVAFLLFLLVLVTILEYLWVGLNARWSQINRDSKSISIETNQTSEQVSENEENLSSSEPVTSNENETETGGSQPRQETEISSQVDEPCPTQQPDVKINPRRRVESLDALRGLTIAGMIYVNYGGAGYPALEHKPWDGITLADFVFPFFIFSMGASIAISSKHLMFGKSKSFGQMMGKILRRSVTLLLLGLCLNSKALRGRGLQYLRFSGVLQRFSISYLVVSLMYCIELSIDLLILANDKLRASCLSRLPSYFIETITCLGFVSIYVYVTLYLDYSDSCPAGYIGPGGLTQGGRQANCTGGAAAWLDRLVLGSSHLYNDTEVQDIFKTKVTHDPEGILGYTTSILLTIIGLQCGKILISDKDHKSRLFMFGQCLLFVALCCASIVIIPVNKRLWSLSFVAVTGTFAILVLLVFYLVLDLYQCGKTLLMRILLSAGKNALFLYVGHSLVDGMLPWHFAVDESSHTQLLVRLTWAVFLWLLISHYMATKKLFIKI